MVVQSYQCWIRKMGVSILAEDLGILCNFEVVLRNALAWKSEARRVITTHTGLVPGIGIPDVDAALSDVERLIDVVAHLRETLETETSSGGVRR